MTNFKEDILLITTRLIVEEGFNYAEAKQKAGSILKPNKGKRVKLRSFPTNLEIEKSVKDYLETFYWEDLNLRVEILHEKAKNLMTELKCFAPTLIGELSRNIATAYTILRICVFADSSKDVLMYLLEMAVTPEVLELKHPFYKSSVEALALTWEDHDAIIYCLRYNDKNFCSKGVSLNTLQNIIKNKTGDNS